MLVGILSDTHDHLDRMCSALHRFRREGVEAVLHPGDLVAPFAARLLKAEWSGPLSVIYGNNDGERKGLAAVLPQITDGPVLVELGGRRISMDHYPPDAEHRPIAGVDVVLFGHTHEVVNETRGGVLYLNLGECCGWVTGRAPVALLDTEALNAEIVQL
ncbi:MAG: metallophosphoesterase [Planctomycetes bacterium]|nr:metallophosphoesterase [Planctomycetota bacterium]